MPCYYFLPLNNNHKYTTHSICFSRRFKGVASKKVWKAWLGALHRTKAILRSFTNLALNFVMLFVEEI